MAILPLLSELSVLLDDHARAATLYELLRPYADRNAGYVQSGFALGSTSYYLGLLAGLLGEPDAAQRHFEDALAFNERMGARPFVAQTQNAYADLLVKRGAPGDREQALELVNQALAAAESIGMTRLAQQALALKVRAQGILKA